MEQNYWAMERAGGQQHLGRKEIESQHPPFLTREAQQIKESR